MIGRLLSNNRLINSVLDLFILKKKRKFIDPTILKINFNDKILVLPHATL